MRILVLGAGGTGGYFGGRLAAAGLDVTFLVREGRAAALARDGLVIESPLGDWRGPVRTVTAADRESGTDLVLLSCKSYDLASAIAAIRPAVGPRTLVLPLLNGLNHLAELDAAFGAPTVLGGLCHLSVTLAPDGRIRHLNRLQLLTYGPRVASQQAAAEAMLPVLRRGGFDAVLSGNVLQDMWEKLVLLATLAGMTCLMRASVGDIVATADGRELMLGLLGECASVAAAAGYRPRANRLEVTRATLTDPASATTASMLRDIEAGSRIEADHIIGDMLRRGVAAGLSVPMLRTAYCHLQCYERRFRRQGA